MSFVIGQSDYFGFGFTTLIWKLLYPSRCNLMYHLMFVFAGNDLFLNSSVHDYLSALLRIYTNPSKLNQLDFNSPIPGLTSFYDL